jgi:hypothetical protein
MPQEIRSYRRSAKSLWLALMWTLFDLLAAVFIFYASSGKHGQYTVAPSLLQRIVASTFCIITTVYIVRFLRTGIWVSSDTLLIRNPIRTYRLKWESIQSIDAPASYGKWRKPGLIVTSVDGMKVSVNLFAKGPFDSGKYVANIVNELQIDLERYRR